MFRESAGRVVSTPAQHLRRLLAAVLQSENIHALVLASELECGLWDQCHPYASRAQDLTDAVAMGDPSAPALIAQLQRAELPDPLPLKTPEGFAYYALDPFSYAREVRTLAAGRRAAVVGIRSAGISLAAACAADNVPRISVRPLGHPYDREVRLTAAHRAWVKRCLGEERVFFVLDEGPGLSGSSFLATAEALEGAGVDNRLIHLIGSHRCDPGRLVARDAARRWSRFQFHVAAALASPQQTRSFKDLDWRAELRPAGALWPAAWPRLTPPKFLSTDGTLFWKYEGLGSAGEAARERSRSLARTGWGPEPVAFQHGFTAYRSVRGRAMSAADLSESMISRLADYCAWRRGAFAVGDAEPEELEAMTTHNVAQLTGFVLPDFRLELAEPVVCDARLAPYEWLQTSSGVLKTDGVAHGDSHFFPGPCDIAWDLAGAVIEWEMDGAAMTALLAAYHRASGDDASGRLPNYLVAYLAFHAAYARMAQSQTEEEESVRFKLDAERYERRLREHLESQAYRRSAIA